jgi:serine/threonine protein kinase/Flp pilus assembly protein TadD/plastocyanin
MRLGPSRGGSDPLPDSEIATVRDVHPLPGMIVGSFQLVRWLGAGGTGDVWLCEDVSSARSVALKLPHADHIRDPKTRQEFLREARAGGMLEHPGIAAVYDVGESPCGPYIAMEFVDGPSLRAVLRERRPSFAESVGWMTAIAEAVACAHAHGIVHGDLSPGNLMLDSAGRPRVVDFGLARTLFSATDSSHSQIHGTYPYMAPELLRGHRPGVGSDVYALGIVLFELLTGQHPHEGRSPGAYLRAVLDGPPRDPGSLEPRLAADLRRVVLDAIAPVLEERIAGAGELAARLRVATFDPVSGITLGDTATTAPVSSRPRDPVGPPSAAQASDGATRALLDAKLLQAHALLRRPDQEASVDAAIAALEAMHRLAPDDPEVLASLGRAYLFKGRHAHDGAWEDRAAGQVARACERAPDSPAVLLAQADLDRIQGRVGQALEGYGRLLELEPRSIDGWVGRSWAYERRGELAEAEKAARAAIDIGALDWRGHSRLGGLHLNRGSYGDALESYRRVVEIAPDHAGGWSNLGTALFQTDRLEEALEAFERSILLQPTAVGFLNAGAVLFYLRRYPEAVAQYEKAVALSASDPRAWGNFGSAARFVPGMANRAKEAFERAIVLMRAHLDRHPDDPMGWAWIANWLAKCGRLEEARDALDHALALDRPRVEILGVVAYAYALLGDDVSAIEVYRRQVERGAGMRWLDTDPALDRLRSTASWQKVIEASRGHNAPQTWGGTMKNEAEAGSSADGKGKTVEIRNEQPTPLEVKLKVGQDRVTWVSADGNEYEVLFYKDAEWPFDDPHEIESPSGEKGIRVPAQGPSRPLRLKSDKMGRHGYRVATERTRGQRKPPNGPAVIGEG